MCKGGNMTEKTVNQKINTITLSITELETLCLDIANQVETIVITAIANTPIETQILNPDLSLARAIEEKINSMAHETMLGHDGCGSIVRIPKKKILDPDLWKKVVTDKLDKRLISK